MSEDEYRKGIATLKNNKAIDIYDILVDQLKNLCPSSHKWLIEMLNTCLTRNEIPKLWRQSWIIAIMKAGKDSTIPKYYRPLVLF